MLVFPLLDILNVEGCEVGGRHFPWRVVWEQRLACKLYRSMYIPDEGHSRTDVRKQTPKLKRAELYRFKTSRLRADVYVCVIYWNMLMFQATVKGFQHVPSDWNKLIALVSLEMSKDEWDSKSSENDFLRMPTKTVKAWLSWLNKTKVDR